MAARRGTWVAADQPSGERGVASLMTLYARIGRTYVAWAPSLLAMAAVVFVPLGLVSALSLDMDFDSLGLGSGLLAVGVLMAVLALVGTSLVGEVFYSGAVAVSLTNGEAGRLSLREISRRLDYRTLIAVDLLYSLAVIVGLIFLFVPGVMLYVWLGLAGPVVEIERHGVRAAFARSIQLVRGSFWLVLAVLVPIELATESFGALAELLTHKLLGDTVWSAWMAETLSNVIATPVLAVGAVILTVELIAARDGRGPRLNSAPSAQ